MAFQLNHAILQILRAPTHSKASGTPVVLPETKPGEGMLTATGLLSHFLAMSIARFVLVAGGFLGHAGLENWDRARQWSGRVFGIRAMG